MIEMVTLNYVDTCCHSSIITVTQLNTARNHQTSFIKCHIKYKYKHTRIPKFGLAMG